MDQRSLGQTGIKVSEIAFGGVEIGIPYGIGVKSEADMISESEAIYLLQEALSCGINFFDTARLYGASESIMGRAFSSRRDQVVICTKCRHLRNLEGHLPPDEKIERMIKESLQESLNDLQTGFIDVYLLHQADMEILDNERIAKVFTELKKEGAIRATGVSTYTPDETKKAIRSGVWDVIQLPFNLMDPTHLALFPMAAAKGVGIMVRSVLLKGILGEKGRELHPALKDVEMHLKHYDDFLNESISDLATLAIKFGLSFKEVSSVLVGIDRMDYLHKSLLAADNLYLNEKTLAKALHLRYPDPEFLDLAEWDRLGWLT
jgi:aryl-alcohol dehydrogenase-like predicted oxidoreductase